MKLVFCALRAAIVLITAVWAGGCAPGVLVTAPAADSVRIEHVGTGGLAEASEIGPVASPVIEKIGPPLLRVDEIAFSDLGRAGGMLSCTLHNVGERRLRMRVSVTDRTTGRVSGPTTWTLLPSGRITIKQPVRLAARGSHVLSLQVDDAVDSRALFRSTYRAFLPPVLRWDSAPRWIGRRPVVFPIHVRPDTPSPPGLRLEVRASLVGGASATIRRPIFGATAHFLRLSVGAGGRDVHLAARLVDGNQRPVTPWLLRRIDRLTGPRVKPPDESDEAEPPATFGEDPPSWLSAFTSVPYGPTTRPDVPAAVVGGSGIRLPPFGRWRLESGDQVLFDVAAASAAPNPRQLKRHQLLDALHARGGRGQLLLVPFVLYTKPKLEAIRLRCGLLDDGRGHKIARGAARFFQQVSSVWIEPSAGPLAAGSATKYVLQIALPSDLPEGVYRGEVTIEFDGGRRSVPLTVEVDAFLMPRKTAVAIMLPVGRLVAGDWRIAGGKLLSMLAVHGAVLPPPTAGGDGFDDLADTWPEADALTRLRRWRPRAPLVVDWRHRKLDGRESLEIASATGSLLSPMGLPVAVHLARSGECDPKYGYGRAWWIRLQNRGDQKVILTPTAGELHALRRLKEDRFSGVLLSQIDPATEAWLADRARHVWWTPPKGSCPLALRWACGLAAHAVGAKAVVVPCETAAGPLLARGAAGKFLPTTGWAALIEALNDLRTALVLDRRIAEVSREGADRLEALAAARAIRDRVRAVARKSLLAGRPPTWRQMDQWRAALADALALLADPPPAGKRTD